MAGNHKQVLFLNLYAFSLTGGIEKVSKNFIYALSKLFKKNNWASYSMYDHSADINEKYTNAENYKAFGGKKFSFIWNSFWKGQSADVVILSHINLLLIAKLISLVSFKKRFILFAHGIEVWNTLSQWKRDFIKKKVEVWAVSQYTKDQMISIHHLLPSQIQILNNCLSPFIKVPNNFDKPQDLIEKYGINKNIPILYTLTRFSSSEKYKGYDNVITALGKLKKQGEKFIYLLAGKADAGEKARLEKLITVNNLNDCVKLIGYLPSNELTRYFLLGDTFIMPSKCEGFGIVFIEAAACGCRIIGGNADGSIDALLNGKLGKLVDPDKNIDIEDAIISSINSPLNHEEKISLQNLCLENFSFKRYLDKVSILLNQKSE